MQRLRIYKQTETDTLRETEYDWMSKQKAEYYKQHVHTNYNNLAALLDKDHNITLWQH